MSLSAPRTVGWSRLSVTLHWLIVALIVVQFFGSEWMEDAWRAFERGAEISGGTQIGARVHVIAGILVFLAALVRLWERFARGRPAYPAGEPIWATRLAQATHALIYAILVAMPVAGLLAWFGGIEDLGEFHEFLWTPLLVLIGVHVAGALAQHLWFRTDSLKRMVRPV